MEHGLSKNTIEAAKQRFSLNAAATSTDIEAFELLAGIKMSLFFKGLYLKFNGFLSPDEKSCINLWCLDDIARRRNLITVRLNHKYIPAGDFLANSEFFLFALEDELAPVCNLDGKDVVAPNFNAFFEMLLGGGFDL